MGRPLGRKNKMRTPEEKEAIVLEYLNGRVGYKEVAKAHEIDKKLFYRWIKKYREAGVKAYSRKQEKALNQLSEDMTVIHQKLRN